MAQQRKGRQTPTVVKSGDTRDIFKRKYNRVYCVYKDVWSKLEGDAR